MTPKVLILLRHGKSGYPDGVHDHDRPLAERGRREASLAGEWLRATQPAVDAVLCSTAARTRQTLIATRIDAPVIFENRIYDASPHQLIDLIRLVDDDVATLLMVGHSPGIPWTAWELAANHSSSPAEQMSTKFPTSAMAVLEIDGRWCDVGTGSAELTAFHVPR